MTTSFPLLLIPPHLPSRKDASQNRARVSAPGTAPTASPLITPNQPTRYENKCKHTLTINPPKSALKRPILPALSPVEGSTLPVPSNVEGSYPEGPAPSALLSTLYSLPSSPQGSWEVLPALCELLGTFAHAVSSFVRRVGSSAHEPPVLSLSKGPAI